MDVGQTVDLIGEKKISIEQDLNEKIMGERNRRLVLYSITRGDRSSRDSENCDLIFTDFCVVLSYIYS